MEGGLAEEGAGDGGRGLFVLYVFGDREGFREGCRRAIMQDRGYGSGGHGDGNDGNGGEGDEGKEEKEREREREGGMDGIVMRFQRKLLV